MSEIRLDNRLWYDQRFKAELDKIEPGLWARLETVPDLPEEAQAAVLRFLLEIGCQATHIRNVTLGRSALCCMPQEWLVSRIEQAAADSLDLDDEWQFRRLGEVYELLDAELVRHLITQGETSPDPAIREAAEDFEYRLAR